MKMNSARSNILWLGCLLAIAHTPLEGQSGSQDLNPASSQGLETLVNIEFTADIRLFAVMAALNAAGFDYETQGKEMSAIRVKVRDKLQDLEPTLLQRLNSFYETHQTIPEEVDRQAPYVSLALLLGGPPDFKAKVPEDDMPSDARHVRGFEPLVEEVFKQARLGELWERYEAEYAEEMNSYQPVVKDVAEESLRYFRIAPRLSMDRKIILIPDLLNARGVVNARNLERVYYVIVGPTGDAPENRRQVQHEYLHFLIDPMVQKHGRLLLRHRDLLEVVQKQPSLKPEYQESFLLVVTESLIESLQLRLYSSEQVNQEMVGLFRDGLVLAPYFHRGLLMYEDSGLVSFPVYIEGLLQGIGESEVEKDEKVVAGLEREMKRAQEEQRKAREEALRQAALRRKLNSLLAEAGVLLSEGGHQAAQEKLDQILIEDPTNANALFYLAQIASQQRRFDAAFDYYERSASSPSVSDWIRAWCVLRMGNHLAFKEDFDGARRKFTQVLNMEGDLRGAPEGARQSLKKLPPEKMK